MGYDNLSPNWFETNLKEIRGISVIFDRVEEKYHELIKTHLANNGGCILKNADILYATVRRIVPHYKRNKADSAKLLCVLLTDGRIYARRYNNNQVFNIGV